MSNFIQNKGQMLIVVLWTIGLVTVGIGTLTMRGVQELRAGRLDADMLEAEAAAQAAVAMAAAVLADDDPSVDHAREPWATGQDPERDERSLHDLLLGRAHVRIGLAQPDGTVAPGLVDEERRMNLNTAPVESLARLIEQLQVDDPNGLAGPEPADLAAAIADWRDAEPGAWCHDPSACHSAPLETVEELLLVPGMRPALVAAMRPYVTVLGLGTVNVNTADEVVLRAMGLTASRIDALMAQREQTPLTSVPGGYPAGFGVQSSCFEVPLVATVRDSAASLRVVAVFDRAGALRAWARQ